MHKFLSATESLFLYVAINAEYFFSLYCFLSIFFDLKKGLKTSPLIIIIVQNLIRNFALLKFLLLTAVVNFTPLPLTSRSLTGFSPVRNFALLKFLCARAAANFAALSFAFALAYLAARVRNFATLFLSQ